MARISLNNGNTTVDVDSLSAGQTLTACEIASLTDGPAYERVDGEVHVDHASWLRSFCEHHEQITGEIFTIG